MQESIEQTRAEIESLQPVAVTKQFETFPNGAEESLDQTAKLLTLQAKLDRLIKNVPQDPSDLAEAWVVALLESIERTKAEIESLQPAPVTTELEKFPDPTRESLQETATLLHEIYKEIVHRAAQKGENPAMHLALLSRFGADNGTNIWNIWQANWKSEGRELLP